ncbi:MAG: immunoglobulin domain-containing protein [Verrucomicrobia bacterium]|nr:immunoglobulin domain-containing protein [Verrucomicrobiota bacterium]
MNLVSSGTVDVQPLNVTRSPSSVAPGDSLSVSWQIRNNGSAAAASSQSQVRISSSSSTSGGPANNVGSAVSTGTIGAGATINQNRTVTVPSLAPGTYYVWVVADNTSLLTQTDYNNDFAVSASFTVSGTVDVQPLNVTRGSSSVAPGASLSVSWQIRNNGSSSAGSSFSQVRISSSASNSGGPAANVGSAVATGTIAAGATINQNTTVTVPQLSAGTYYVWVIADNTSLLSQSNTGNDFAVSASFTVTSPLLPPVPETPGTEGDVGHTIANLTPTFTWSGGAGATRYGLYVSKEPYGAANIIYSNVNLTGTSHQPSGNLQNGVKYRWNMTSFNSGGSESSVSPHLYFQTPASATGPAVQTTAPTQQSTTSARLNGTVNPNGLNTTWYFQYGTTTSFGQSTLAGAFGAGISTVQNVGYTIGGLAPNTLYHYRLVAQNSQGTSYGNNMTVQSLPLNQPDLIVENVTFSPSSVPSGNSFTVNFRIRNQGTANCVATLARLRLSLDTNLTLADPPLSPLDVAIPAIPAGNYYDYSGTVTIPSTTPQGLYYVGIFADADNRAGQSDITNDGGVSASRVTVTGSGATLPVILGHPQNRNATQGDTVSFSVTVSGTGPFSYQWKREGRPIYGETSSQLVLRNVSTLQSGSYAVAVANAAGTVTSSSALLTVSPLTPPTTQPLPGQCTIYGTIDPSLPTVVIAHGWQPGESPGVPAWVTAMSQAVVDRCAAAGLPANGSGQRVNIIRYYWQEAFTLNLLNAITYTRNHGSALARQLKSPTILGPSYDKKIQFIGHSLGSLVNAYAVYDLQTWNVEQFTILDAPLAAPSVDPWLFHRYLPADRVKWVDNYYGTSTAPPAAAGGIISASAPSGGLALNANHSGVHDFYHNTIANAATSQGFYYSCLLPNFDSRPQPQWWTPPPAPLYQGLLGVFNDAPELVWYGLENVSGLVETGLYWIGNQLQNAIILNKPASGSPLIAKSGGPTPAGAGGPEPAGGDGISEVSAAIDLVIPADAQYLTFKFLCPNAGPGDWLTAKFNDNLLMSFRADSFTGTNFQTATMSVSDYAGQAGQLVMKLNSGGTDASEFVIGDFSFVAGSAPVFSNPRVLSGAFQFDLRGLVGSNYVVQVSTNLINWSSMTTSTIPVEGSITITNPISGQPKKFYRAVTP